MKSNYIMRATKFMEAFYPYMRKYEIRQAIRLFNEKNHRMVRLCKGAVRYVLVTSDYVIKWDYNKQNSKCFGGCREEYHKYQEVKNDYFGYLFAEITPIKVKHRIFYVMPRVESLGIDHNQYIDEVLEEEEIHYLYEEACIGDIHDENWGYINGQPVIIDYACGSLA